MTLFERLESDLLEEGREPLSVSPERERLERAYLELWSTGNNTTIAGLRRWVGERDADASTSTTPDAGAVVGDSD
jgi:hypothetical protein